MTEPVLPLEALAMHVGILGKTGSGKSNLAKVEVERLLDAGQRVCVLDPTGTWYGLRLLPDRSKSDYDVVIFGGTHADISLAASHGSAVAEAIGTSTTSAIIDTRSMSVRERTEFFTAFAETLLQRNRGSLHLVVDEAHVFAPQGRVADPKSGQMVHAANNLVSLGRGIGIKAILISQRPAKLHKDSLTQVETLVAMRLIAPQDRRAIEDWVGEWADPKQAAELLSQLPSMPTGDAWVWSPEIGLLELRHAPLARTLDTGKPSDEPIELVPIDVDDMRERLGAVEQEIAANDPARLKARIRELEQSLKDLQVRTKPDARVAELEEQLRAQHRELLDSENTRDRYADALDEIASIAAVRSGARPDAGTQRESGLPTAAAAQSAPRVEAPARNPTKPWDAGAGRGPGGYAPSNQSTQGKEGRAMGAGGSGSAEPGAMPRGTKAPTASIEASDAPGVATVGTNDLGRLILRALVDAPEGRPAAQIALMTGYSPAGGFFRRSLAALRSQGLIEGDRPHLTSSGLDQNDDAPRIPTGRPLLEMWLANPRLGTAAAAFVRALADAGRPLSTAELGEVTNYSPSGGYFRRGVKKARDMGLVSGTRELSLAPELVS